MPTSSPSFIFLEGFDWQPDDNPYTVAYRAVRRGEPVHLNVWLFPLPGKAELPTVPLWLAADLTIPLDLELTYHCRV
jgi:hypothetical protein